MLLSAASRRDPEPPSMRERLEAAASGLGELEQLRKRHEALVRGALEVREEPCQEASGCLEEEALQENVLLLRRQLNCLRRRDTGLITQLQELDGQISKLRLDTAASHDPLKADSRPSSGFFDLSDGASLTLSNSSNSVFSDCFCFTVAEADAPSLSAEDHHSCLDCDSSQLPTLDSTHKRDKPHLLGFSSTHLRQSVPPPAPLPAAAASQKRLDSYILGLLHRRAPPIRVRRPRTSVNTEPCRVLASGPPPVSGGAPPGGCAIQKVSPNGDDRSGVLTEKTKLPAPSLPRLHPPPRPLAPPALRSLPAASSRGREGAGVAGGGGRRSRGRGSRVATVGGTSRKSHRSSSRDPGDAKSARHRCHRQRRPRTPVIRSPPMETGGSNCFGDGELVKENLEDESHGRWRSQVRPLRHEVTRAVVRIKASSQLKKKILRFRSGSLKLMTTV